MGRALTMRGPGSGTGADARGSQGVGGRQAPLSGREPGRDADTIPGMPFVHGRDPVERRFLKAASGQLQTNRQIPGRQAAWHRDRGQSCERSGW